MIRLEDPNNFGCTLRDGIYKNLDKFYRNGNYSLLRERLEKIEIPQEHWGDILIMSDYRKYDRIKDWVEELLEGVVIRHIITELLNEELGITKN